MPVFQKFRAGFIGKSSPVHFFWGSFDLAVSRFSGRRAPEKPGADIITKEGYSHEVISVGFWPGDGELIKDAAFYAYAAPEPAGFKDSTVLPGMAFYSKEKSEFFLMYDDVRLSDSPEQALLDFCQSTYEAGANLAHWNRAELERPPGQHAVGAAGDQFYITHCTTTDSVLNNPGYTVRAASSMDSDTLDAAFHYPPYELPIGMVKDLPAPAQTPRRLALTRDPDGGTWVVHSVYRRV